MSTKRERKGQGRLSPPFGDESARPLHSPDDNYNRSSVDHSEKQYVDGAIPANTIEGFWSLIKRGVMGSYHKVSRKYLPLYVAEFQFRYNNSLNTHIFWRGGAGLLKAFAIVVAVLAVSAAPALSQKQSHTENQYLGINETQGSEKTPLFVKIVPAEKSATDITREESKEREAAKIETRLADLTGDLANYTWKLFIATAILAGLTAGLLGLGIAQAFDNKRSIRATEIAAKAARDSADAAVSQLRPVMAVGAKGLQREDNLMVIWFELENSGQSTAYKVQTLSGVQFLPRPLPGPLQPFATTTTREIANFDIPRGKKHASRKKMERPPTDQEMADWMSDKFALYLVGKIAYTTDFGDEIELDFCHFLDWESYCLWCKGARAMAGGIDDARFGVAPFENDTRVRRKGDA